MNLTAAILAGGKSRRMGVDKAALEWGGVSLLARIAGTCIDSGLPAIVVGRPMPEDWPIPSVRFFPDDSPEQGPIGGLVTVLRACASGGVVALPCDMPLLDRRALEWLLSQAKLIPDLADGVAVVSDGRLQPLFAVYLQGVLPLALDRMSLGKRSLSGLIEAGEFHRLEAPAWIGGRLANVNTPEDLALLAESFHKFERLGFGFKEGMS